MESTGAKRPIVTMHRIYKAFWIVMIAGVIGYVVETIFCLIKNGEFESRQGLLYAPFTQIYGLGALILMLAARLVQNKSNKWVFWICAVCGGAFEFLCSWLQEYFLGVQSWHYPIYALSLTGRTCLIYMLFWGILGIFMINSIYPKLSLFLDRLLDNSGRALTWIIAVFMLLNTFVTVQAISRWTDRQAGEPVQSEYQVLLDEIYPDELMGRIFPKMVLVENRMTKHKKSIG